MWAVHIILGIWIALVIYSTYNLYTNPNYIEAEKEAEEDLEALVGKSATRNLVIMAFILVTVIDLAMLGTIYYFYETKLLNIAIPICILLDLICSYFMFTKRQVNEQIEITRQCLKCFIAVMAAVYMIF